MSSYIWLECIFLYMMAAYRVGLLRSEAARSYLLGLLAANSGWNPTNSSLTVSVHFVAQLNLLAMLQSGNIWVKRDKKSKLHSTTLFLTQQIFCSEDTTNCVIEASAAILFCFVLFVTVCWQ